MPFLNGLVNQSKIDTACLHLVYSQEKLVFKKEERKTKTTWCQKTPVFLEKMETHMLQCL